jgi:hypothetical protein
MPDRNGSAETECEKRKKTTAPGRNSWTLSWLAEKADGTRDKKLQLIAHDTLGLSIQDEDYQPGTDEHFVCYIETPSCQPTRKKVVAATLTTEDKIDHPITVTKDKQWDAVFWTESSIEKFLYPYYHAQRIWDDELENLKASFEAYPLGFGMRHRAPSASEPITLATTLEVGVIGMDLVPQWYSPQAFIDLVRKQFAVRAAANPEAAGRGPDTPEQAGAPSRTR